VRRGAHTANPEHMPHSHRLYRQEQMPEPIVERADQIGPATCELVRIILQTLPVLAQSAPSCFGLLSLAGRYTPERLEAACRRWRSKPYQVQRCQPIAPTNGQNSSISKSRTRRGSDGSITSAAA